MATTYIVLRETEDHFLDIVGTADTDTPRQAIKAFSEDGEGETHEVSEGGYVAVPLRNWTEEDVTVERRVTYRSRDIVPGGGARELIHVPEPVLPGQVSIEEAIEVEELAGIIEGEPESEADPNEQDDPNEFGPETEEPFDPANLGGKDEAA